MSTPARPAAARVLKEPTPEELSEINSIYDIMTWAKIEGDLLNGQKLQGTLTAREAHAILERRNFLHEFPLIKVIYEIAFEGKPVREIVQGISVSPRRSNDFSPNYASHL